MISSFLLLEARRENVKRGGCVAFFCECEVKSAFHVEARSGVELELIELVFQENYKFCGLGFKVLDVTIRFLHERNAFFQIVRNCSFKLTKLVELSLLEVEVIDNVDNLHRLVFDLILFILALFKSVVLSSLGSVGTLDLKHPAVVNHLMREAIIEELVATNHAREQVHHSYFNNKILPP